MSYSDHDQIAGMERVLRCVLAGLSVTNTQVIRSTKNVLEQRLVVEGHPPALEYALSLIPELDPEPRWWVKLLKGMLSQDAE
jgi:hypothetical protein